MEWHRLREEERGQKGERNNELFKKLENSEIWEFRTLYNGKKKMREDTIDENNGQQLGFENVFVAFADISKYPYPGGGSYDPNYQKVDLSYGGLGYYFSNGRMGQIRWFKGGASEPLRFTDMDENPLVLNCGKSYIGFVDLDEYERFEFVGPEEEIVEEQIDDTQETTTEVETE